MLKKVGKTGEITEKIVKTRLKKEGDHWVNEDVKIISHAKCYVPNFIISVLKALTRVFAEYEFSIFCKFEYDSENRRIKILPEYFIPKQTVGSASVNYNEGPPAGYQVVIHKHPNGVVSFSDTDNKYINQNHDVSLLWENNQFRKGQVRINTDYGRIAIPLKIETDLEILPTIPKEDLNKISPVIYPSYEFAGKCNKKNKNNRWPNPGKGFKMNNKRRPINLGDNGLLNSDQEKVGKLLFREGITYGERDVDQIYDIMIEEGKTWDRAEEIYKQRLETSGGVVDVGSIDKMVGGQQPSTKIPGAVNGSRTSIPGAMLPQQCGYEPRPIPPKTLDRKEK